MSIELGTGEWLKPTGPDADVVISTRIRLARNVRGYPFRPRLRRDQHEELEALLARAIARADLEEQVAYTNLEPSSRWDRQLLLERHLISREHAEGEGARGVAVNRAETCSIMTLEEDHLRLQVLRSGLDLKGGWEAVNRIDDALEEQVEYAFDPELGYLTACPTNVGTGLRVSVMLHLPGLVITGHVERMFRSVSKVNLVVRGLYGEGTKALGDFFQISNQVTLGRSEEELIREFGEFVPHILDYERKIRERLLQEDRETVEDRVYRARGALCSARAISSEEAMEKLSLVRLGVNMGLLPDLEIGEINSILIHAQPAHIVKRAGRDLDAEERDIERAKYIQQVLARN